MTSKHGNSHIEPVGLGARDVIDLLLAIETPVAGADIVELNPNRDLNGMTAALAAKLVKEPRRAGRRLSSDLASLTFKICSRRS